LRYSRLVLSGDTLCSYEKDVNRKIPEKFQKNFWLLMLRTVALTHGLPHILYHDRHTILRSPKQATIEDELAGRKPQSQIQRIIAQLGITSIPALSPQAKGRIERLWQTFQDRLRKEMRLAGIDSLEQANRFCEVLPFCSCQECLLLLLSLQLFFLLHTQP
jgi:hypothetical protein